MRHGSSHRFAPAVREGLQEGSQPTPFGCDLDRRDPARMIEVISPAGVEHFFWDLGEVMASGVPDPETIAALAEKHGLVFERPPWLTDVIARYNLTPPPIG
ncbi:MAG TPA: hypothetical protein VEK80_16920 [Kribbellaceae bacterium]|nr:hypothetical protein [Kribbellaceae bacterium]